MSFAPKMKPLQAVHKPLHSSYTHSYGGMQYERRRVEHCRTEGTQLQDEAGAVTFAVRSRPISKVHRIAGKSTPTVYLAGCVAHKRNHNADLRMLREGATTQMGDECIFLLGETPFVCECMRTTLRRDCNLQFCAHPSCVQATEKRMTSSKPEGHDKRR